MQRVNMDFSLAWLGDSFWPPASTQASPLGPATILYGTIFISFWVCASLNCRPIKRFVPKSVFVGLVTACRLAGVPTSLSPLGVKATMEGVVLAPSAFSMTLGLYNNEQNEKKTINYKYIPFGRVAMQNRKKNTTSGEYIPFLSTITPTWLTLPSMTATQEFVVPKSIPTTSFPAAFTL